MINTIRASAGCMSIAVTESTVDTVTAAVSKCSKLNESTNFSPRLTLLSRQLSESAERARVRDSTLSRKELGELATKLELQFRGANARQKAERASHVPETDEPERLERAAQATRFIANGYRLDPSVANPFAGLSREQLTLIVYDDSGSYTLNEREAASINVGKMEEQWGRKLLADGWAESSQTGGCPDFYRECLAHYRALPVIEQARHPVDYESRLLDSIEKEAQKQGQPKEYEPFLTLAEFLARMNKKLPGQVAGSETPSPSDKPANTDELKTNN